MTSLDTLVGLLLGAPALPGAKCRRRHHLFDEPAAGESPERVRQRHAQALRLCEICPARQPCEEWFFTRLTPRTRPYGVCAGQIRTRRTKDTADE